MPWDLTEKAGGAVRKHLALEVIAVSLLAIALSGVVLYFMIQYFALEIHFEIGDVLLAYVPHILIIALGGVLMSYPKGNVRWVGLGVLLVGIGLIIIDLINLLYLA